MIEYVLLSSGFANTLSMWQLFINFVLKINPAQKFIRSYPGLAVVTLDIPPMRERCEDIPHIADFF
jgi:hypothetical protein